jgi:hypothetical protein
LSSSSSCTGDKATGDKAKAKAKAGLALDETKRDERVRGGLEAEWRRCKTAASITRRGHATECERLV